MGDLAGLFASVPLPYKYCQIPSAADPPIVRKSKQRFYIHRVGTQLTRCAFAHAGFAETKHARRWNASWGRQYELDEYAACQPWQSVNHFAGAYLIGRKDQLHKRMMELRKRGSSFVPFYPQSFLVPADFEQLQKEWKNRSFWIVKPVASSRGRGIRVVSSKEIGPPRKSGHLVQEYIWNPYLITGRKFDLRLYILVSSICPFRIYIHESGLARFATRQYDVSISPTDRRMHLTNFAVNRVDTSFVSCQESESIENSKWSLPFLFRYLEVEGIDVVALKKDIESVAVTTILAGMIEIRDFHRRYVTHRHTCYELYGIDILLDSDLKPYVMEINISPSLNSKDSKLDFSLKFPLMLDLLRVARIIRCNAKLNNPCPGVFLMDKAYRSSLTHQRRVDVESQGVDPWLAPVFADFAIVRDFVEEKQRLGGFHRVFPKRTPGNAYDHLFSSKKYEDLVLGAWVQKSASDRHRALLRSWPSYASAMSQLHAQSPRQRAPTAR